MLDDRVGMIKIDGTIGKIGKIPGVTNPVDEQVLSRRFATKFGGIDVEQSDPGNPVEADIVPVIPPATDIEDLQRTPQFAGQCPYLFCQKTAAPLSEHVHGSISDTKLFNHYTDFLSRFRAGISCTVSPARILRQPHYLSRTMSNRCDGVHPRRSALPPAVQGGATWTEGILDAILEVENALVQYDAATSATTAAADAARLYDEARDLTRVVYEKGDAAWGDLIDAESAIASADRRYQRARAFVELDVALGAGHAAGAPP